MPDYHAFRGAYGGYAFPLNDNRPLFHGSNVHPRLVAGLTARYGISISPETIFDAILALLSARSYTRRFAEDLEHVFPHLPFPRATQVFVDLAALGTRIRLLQTFDRTPDAAFQTTKVPEGPIAGTLLDTPTWLRSFTA
jgi:predicted helicase